MTLSTPMQALKFHIDKIKEKSGCDFFTLNKSKPKDSHYWHYSQGVSSDFIIVFKTPTLSFDSFSIVFDYIGKPIEDWKVIFQIKQQSRKKNAERKLTESANANKSILSSGFISINDFKSKINALNSVYKFNDNRKTYIETLVSMFIHKDQENKNSSIESTAESIFSKIEEDTKRVKTLKENIKEQKSEFETLKAKVESSTKRTKEYKNTQSIKAEIEVLKEKLKESELALNQRHLSIKEEKGLLDSLNKLKSLEEEFRTTKILIKRKINENIETIPNLIKDEVETLILRKIK